MSTFDDIRIGFYNELATSLSIPNNEQFQMLQPATPVQANKDSFLWNYFNLIPEHTLATNATPVAGNQFYSNYSGLLSALAGAPNTFEQDVGPQCNAEWNAVMAALPPTTTLNQLPQIFYRWAIMHGWSSVATQGTNDLSQMLLDPITSAQLAMLMATGPTWDQGYADLVAQLSVAPSLHFAGSSSTWSSSSSTSWANSSESAVFGLWSTDSSSSTESSQFAASNITVTGSFEHVTTFMPVPGQWYSSAAMGLAYSHQQGAPWKGTSPINWQNTFSDTNGNLARFSNSLVIVSGMTITVTSDAVFSAQQQSQVTQNESAGLWPFYNRDSSSGSTSSASFNAAGNLTITISSPTGTSPIVPIILGMNVLPVSAFVGHAVAGAQMHAAALSAMRNGELIEAELVSPAIPLT